MEEIKKALSEEQTAEIVGGKSQICGPGTTHEDWKRAQRRPTPVTPPLKANGQKFSGVGHAPGTDWDDEEGRWLYKVKTGDSLAAIANRFNVSLSDIIAMNSQINDKHWIFPNDVIQLA